ncbi:putative protein kinase-like domain superfamily [Plasmopara halstedii]
MDVERLKSVYETPRGLNEGSQIAHLQTVKKVDVVARRPFCYEIASGLLSVERVVHILLTALQYWHGCEYCHRDIRWCNIVLVPTSGVSSWVLIDIDESRQPNTTTIRWIHRCHGHKLRVQHD